MITKAKIKKLANEASYNRGVSIQRSYWKIEEFAVEKNGETDEIMAWVAGNSDNSYEVRGYYDLETDTLEDIYCDCPAYSSYSGICKHCVAVLLEYEEYCERQKALADYAVRTGKQSASKLEPGRYDGQGSKAPGNSRVVPAKVRKTTPKLKQLLEQQERRRLAPYLQREVFGQVRLEPHLVCYGEDASLEFKIGSSQMYVLKDVFAFAANMEKNADYSYGKKLQFVHMAEAFAEKSRGLANFIINWTKRNGDRYQQTVFYAGYGMGTVYQKLRQIPLNGYELEEFFDALGNQPVYVGMADQIYPGMNSSEKESLWTVVDGAPRRVLRITGMDAGIELEMVRGAEYRGERYSMCFQDGYIYLVPRKEETAVQDFLACLEENENVPVYIQNEDVPVFCRDLLPELEKRFSCVKEKFDETKFVVDPVMFRVYLDMPQTEFITCRILAVYGEKEYNLYDKETQKHARDRLSEMEAEQMISPWFNAYNPLEMTLVLAEDEEMLYRLLTEGIFRIQEMGEVFISEELKKLKVRSAPKVEVGVSLEGNLLELEMSVEDISREELIEILSRYRKRKKYYRMKNGDFLNIDDEKIEMLYELKEGMGLKDNEIGQERLELPRYRALYLDIQLRENQSLPVVKNKEFKSLIRNMKTVEDNDFELPVQMEKVLREYQKRGFLWIKTLKYNGFGGILADDMGLGKTLQVIAFLLSEYQEAKGEKMCRSLIVAPASLVFNWQSEIARFAPELPVKMIVGPLAERKKKIQTAGKQEILLTSYDLLKRDEEYYEHVPFACQVIDEAQYIKNHNTQAARAVRRIRADFKLALTGTPVENRLSELWSIFDYLMPGFLYAYQRFKTDLEQPIVQSGNEEAAKRLQKMVRPFVLRRLKRDVLKDLPDKIEKNTYARLEGEQQKLYDAHVKRLRLLLDKQSEEEFKNSRIVVLAELTKLRQLCCCPGLVYEDYPHVSAKETLCLDLIENAVGGGHKVLLFSQFTSMLDRLERLLDERNISYYVLTGAVSKEKRSKMVQAFNEDETSVFCISLKAGGTGLNLTAADIVIHYDPWWNFAVQNQATDRAHRIGQENVVSVYKLIAKGTIEENIVRLQEQKKELADQILSGEEMGSGSFSREELIELLGEM